MLQERSVRRQVQQVSKRWTRTRSAMRTQPLPFGRLWPSAKQSSTVGEPPLVSFSDTGSTGSHLPWGTSSISFHVDGQWSQGKSFMHLIASGLMVTHSAVAAMVSMARLAIALERRIAMGTGMGQNGPKRGVKR
jgi:hypothetical protein